MKEKLLVAIEEFELVSWSETANDERTNTTQQYTHHRLRNTEKQPVNQFTKCSDESAFAPNEMLSQDKTSNSIRLRLKRTTTNLVGHNNQPETKLFIPSKQQQIILSERYNNRTAWKSNPVE
jgi:hypothetical protein